MHVGKECPIRGEELWSGPLWKEALKVLPPVTKKEGTVPDTGMYLRCKNLASCGIVGGIQGGRENSSRFFFELWPLWMNCCTSEGKLQYASSSSIQLKGKRREIKRVCEHLQAVTIKTQWQMHRKTCKTSLYIDEGR
ncbi:hypothetical protein KP509_19G033800 [Ceratopteris richardii]|uniref:Uncharacterized protein n=1 Tax=Ceratopteris richardii TaxID=49495 RepID=A0A8T2SMV9_CERRI|nr:hypothetical protein KP509_19G033800 [Ceratopteris richardii]